MRVGIVVNPLRSAADQATDLLVRAVLQRQWPSPIIRETSVGSPGAEQTRQLLELGVDRVVVCGGDGTVRAVAGELAATRVGLGVVSIGTANLFARNLRLPMGRGGTLELTGRGHTLGPGLRRRGLSRAVHVALDGATRRVDLGTAELDHPDACDRPDRQLFLVVAGLGHDADTVADTSATLKHRISWAAYFEPALTRLTRSGRPVRLVIDGDAPLTQDAWCVLVGVGGRIPLNIDLFPEAALDDGQLDVAVVAPASALDWVPIGLSVLTRRTQGTAGLRYARGVDILIEAVEPVAVQLDGDPHPPVRRLRLGVRPQALLVAAPPAPASPARPTPGPVSE